MMGKTVSDEGGTSLSSGKFLQIIPYASAIPASGCYTICTNEPSIETIIEVPGFKHGRHLSARYYMHQYVCC